VLDPDPRRGQNGRYRDTGLAMMSRSFSFA
jgi:hypothetical protein